MLKTITIQFLTQLAENNNKPWFDEHRKEYAAAKANFEQVTDDVIGRLATADPAFREIRAKDCVFRIFRDVRFSTDKTPYKANFGAGISRGGRKFAGAGYYLHLEPGGKTFAGGGIWMPEAEPLKKVRQEIDYNFDQFKAIIEAPAFSRFFKTIEGDTLKKAPQGYTDDNPAIQYLKMKSFTTGYNFADDELLSPAFPERVAEVFVAMMPFITFLNHAVEL